MEATEKMDQSRDQRKKKKWRKRLHLFIFKHLLDKIKYGDKYFVVKIRDKMTNKYILNMFTPLTYKEIQIKSPLGSISQLQNGYHQ